MDECSGRIGAQRKRFITALDEPCLRAEPRCVWCLIGSQGFLQDCLNGTRYIRRGNGDWHRQDKKGGHGADTAATACTATVVVYEIQNTLLGVIELSGQDVKTRTPRCPMGEADDGKFVAKGTVDYLRLTGRAR